MTRQLMRPFRLNFPTLLPIEHFESLFDNFFGGLDANVYNPNTCTLSLRKFPKGDLYIDKDSNRVIELALAGYSKEQLSVTVEDGTLTIAATKCEDECECGEDEECKCCHPRTLARRAFKQVFSSLGEDFSLEKSEVSYKNGLLKIIVPRAERQEITKQLEIK
ncbi:hypothetical protein LCGC14_1518500 [marine sediment metagenome]|uniref:SHSP domain-containing protein n=1 Tax=marine sediment metagenome TaxID=412755 RepID=A0A0F9IZH7_9ZZZZ